MGIRRRKRLGTLWGLRSFKCDRADVLMGHVELGFPVNLELGSLGTHGQQLQDPWIEWRNDGLATPYRGLPNGGVCGHQ